MICVGQKVCLLFLFWKQIVCSVQSEFTFQSITAVLARINVSYVDREGNAKSQTADIGRFASGAVGVASGLLVVGRASNKTDIAIDYSQGCVAGWATPPQDEPWVALILRGGCPDEEKVNVAYSQNASGVMLYGNEPQTFLQTDNKFKEGTVVLYSNSVRGAQLSSLILRGGKVYISISKGQEVKIRFTSINRTSVLFVSVSFIVLMVVSLAWLVFYYIQRFRYINAKDKLARHLNNAAKKALSKIPVKTIRNGDKDLLENECCAVCIEPYQVSDMIRSLPCNHEFHRQCVDPWLLEHRTCPMCKMDILKYYGYVQSGSSSETVNDPSVHDFGNSRNASRQRFSSSRTPVSVISSNEILPASVEPISGTNHVSSLPPIRSSSFESASAALRALIPSTRRNVTLSAPSSHSLGNERHGSLSEECERIASSPQFDQSYGPTSSSGPRISPSSVSNISEYVVVMPQPILSRTTSECLGGMVRPSVGRSLSGCGELSVNATAPSVCDQLPSRISSGIILAAPSQRMSASLPPIHSGRSSFKNRESCKQILPNGSSAIRRRELSHRPNCVDVDIHEEENDDVFSGVTTSVRSNDFDIEFLVQEIIDIDIGDGDITNSATTQDITSAINSVLTENCSLTSGSLPLHPPSDTFQIENEKSSSCESPHSHTADEDKDDTAESFPPSNFNSSHRPSIANGSSVTPYETFVGGRTKRVSVSRESAQAEVRGTKENKNKNASTRSSIGEEERNGGGRPSSHIITVSHV